MKDEIEDEIEKFIFNDKEIALRPIKENIGQTIIEEKGYKYYIDHLKSTINVDSC